MKKIFSKIYFFLKFIVPVVFVAGIIFYLSAQAGLGDIKNNVTETFLRKGAHFTEYGLLTFFVWRLFYDGWKFSFISSFWFSLILTTLYACSDEFHQTFVAGRSGKPIDVLVDFLSIFTVLQVILFFIRRKIKNIWLAFIGFMCLATVVGMMAKQSYEISKNLEQKNVAENILTNAKENFNNDNDENQGVIITTSGDVKNNTGAKDTGNKNVDNDNLQVKNFNNKNTKRQLFDTEKLPKAVKYKVPFTTQAPFSKWDELHEESCEEAGLIMLKYYNDERGKNTVSADREPGILPSDKKVERSGLSKIPKVEAEGEIQKLVKYQIKKYGDYFDTDVRITKEIGEDFYGLKNLKIIENFTVQDLKKELARGNIVLVPTAGRELGNPNFTPPGPLYHNLVITGYDDKQTMDSVGHKVRGVFITNDPGTRRGQNYKYNQKVLYKAIHDFPGDVNKILEGEKRAIVLVSEQ